MKMEDMEKKLGGHDLSGIEILLADGFDDALIGLGQQFNTTVAIYDRNKCIELLMKDMGEEEAIVFTGSYQGKNTPVFVELFQK